MRNGEEISEKGTELAIVKRKSREQNGELIKSFSESPAEKEHDSCGSEKYRLLAAFTVSRTWTYQDPHIKVLPEYLHKLGISTS